MKRCIFTRTELLAVIAIITIISTVLLAVLSKGRARAPQHCVRLQSETDRSVRHDVTDDFDGYRVRLPAQRDSITNSATEFQH